jgi:hypothetical protein
MQLSHVAHGSVFEHAKTSGEQLFCTHDWHFGSSE